MFLALDFDDFIYMSQFNMTHKRGKMLPKLRRFSLYEKKNLDIAQTFKTQLPVIAIVVTIVTNWL